MQFSTCLIPFEPVFPPGSGNLQVNELGEGELAWKQDKDRTENSWKLKWKHRSQRRNTDAKRNYVLRAEHTQTFKKLLSLQFPTQTRVQCLSEGEMGDRDANLAATSAGGRSPGTGGGDEMMRRVNHVKTEWWWRGGGRPQQQHELLCSDTIPPSLWKTWRINLTRIATGWKLHLQETTKQNLKYVHEWTSGLQRWLNSSSTRLPSYSPPGILTAHLRHR